MGREDSGQETAIIEVPAQQLEEGSVILGDLGGHCVVYSVSILSDGSVACQTEFGQLLLDSNEGVWVIE